MEVEVASRALGAGGMLARLARIGKLEELVDHVGRMLGARALVILASRHAGHERESRGALHVGEGEMSWNPPRMGAIT